MNYGVEVAEIAREAIRDYVRLIAIERHAPTDAERWLGRVSDAIDSLAQFPRRCSLAPENQYRSYEIRMHMVGDYVIQFSIDEASSTVHVIGFRRGHRQPLEGELPTEPPT